MAGYTPDENMPPDVMAADDNVCTMRREFARALYECHKRFRVVADYTFNWELWTAPDGTMEYISPACKRVCGFDPEHFYKNPDFMEAIMHEEDLPTWRHLKKLMQEGAEKGEAEFRLRTPDGRERWIQYVVARIICEDGCFVGFRATCNDITDRKMMLTQLKYQAWHDPLTDLPNRALCMDRIGRTLERAKRAGLNNFAVIFVDIDRFKVINDSMGHTTGDQVLRDVAARLREQLRGMDTVSRLGADEFAILLEEVDGEEQTHLAVERFRTAIESPIHAGIREVHITASFGIAMGAQEYSSAEDMLRNANIAMYQARSKGVGNVAFFHESMLTKALHRMHIEIDLHRAMEEQEFYLVYQPIVNIKTRAVTGFEALIRWDHPERGTVSPAEFIPVSEGTGQILRIGNWVLHQACRTMARWQNTYSEFRELIVNVNLSARQLMQPDIVSQVADALKETGLPPYCLRLEVTETMLMENPEYANLALRRLKELGVHLSIDDFGTGYSSLSYLQQFPIDTLKVDHSFVGKMSREPGNFKIVQAVVALAHSLGLTVVAEGVEEEEQRIMLSELQCDSAQGFLFSEPLEEDIIPSAVFGLPSETEKGAA